MESVNLTFLNEKRIVGVIGGYSLLIKEPCFRWLMGDLQTGHSGGVEAGEKQRSVTACLEPEK